MARKARVSAAIIELMQEAEHHAWTLEELHAGLLRGGHGMDFSSVFRAAEKLVSEGLVRKLQLEDGRTRFELAGAHHDHLYCTRCHEIVAIPCVMAADDLVAIERATGASISGHHLVLNGVCGNCRAAAEKAAC